jgi:hypothetical protein
MRSSRFSFKQLAIVAIILLTYFFWKELPNMMVRGEGFVYLVDRLQTASSQKPRFLVGIEVGSVIVGETLTALFGTQMSAYFWTVLLFITIINILFFITVLTITRSRVISTIATLILIVHYFGNWEMYAGGIYAYFLERVPCMVLLIPSLLFLHKFLEYKKRVFYFVSLLLYFLGVFIAHWSFIFTGLYLFYPFFWFLFMDKKNLKQGILIGLPYFFITAFFSFMQTYYHGGLGPTWTFRDFILNPTIYKYPEKILRQLTYWSEYPVILNGINSSGGYVNTPLHHLGNIKNAIAIQNYVLLVYSMAIFVTYKLLPRLRYLLLTLIFTVSSIFFINAFIGQYQIFTEPSANRYLYPPTFFLSLFWGMFLYVLLWRSKITKGILSVIIIIFMALNYNLISTNFSWLSERHIPSLIVWNKAIDIGVKAEDKTAIIIPGFETGKYEAEFLNDQIGKGRIKFISDDEDNLKGLASDSAKIVRIKYDKKCECAEVEGYIK